MGTKIIEQGSTAGGIAKVEYKDESGNVLYEVNDSDKIFKMVNGKISGLAGTGTRMVTTDASGKLSALAETTTSISVTEVDTQVGQNTTVIDIKLLTIIDITNGHAIRLIAVPNYSAGSDIKVGLFGFGVSTISEGSRFAFRIGANTMEITFPPVGGQIMLRRQTAGTTSISFAMKSLI